MRSLKLSLTKEQHAVISAAVLLSPDEDDPHDWLAEQLTAACQRRIDEAKQAAKVSPAHQPGVTK